MSWDDLTGEVSDLFGDLVESAEFEAQVTIEWWLRERQRKNREAAKAHSKRRWALDAEHREKRKRQMRENNRRRYADPVIKEQHRAYMREYMRARYARLKAAQQQCAA